MTKTIVAPFKELATGSILAGRYQVIEEVGHGGMGRVYKVVDKEVGEKIALKLLNLDIASDADIIQRFRNELRLARKIIHKNVCRMYDLGQAEGAYYITMEYIQGENLRSSLTRMGPLSAGKTIAITEQICEGLAEAHKLGIVHRDLKPQNIMIDAEGNAHIMDFGIARFIKAGGITREGMLIGTPEYMSPEQVEGEEPDPRSDLYSLGIILYEMATGKVPFAEGTPFSIALKQKTDIPANPAEVNAQVPDELSRIIMKCLEKDKVKRFRNAEELFSALAAADKKTPTTKKFAPAEKSAVREAKKSLWKKIVPVTAGIFAMTAIVLAVIYLYKSRHPTIQAIAVLPFDSGGLPGSESEYLGEGIMETLINKVSELPGLKVISSFSVLKYKGKTTDLNEIGRDLNVQAVLTGRISQRGDSLWILAEFIDAKDGHRIWGEQYNRKPGDIFIVQESISREISRSLRLKLTGQEEKLLAKRYTENLDAYNQYLQGRIYWNKRTHADLKKAIGFFERAVEIDPGYALGYASIAETYTVIGSITLEAPSKVYPKAEEYAQKALALDPELPQAHTALGAIKLWKNVDLEGAEAEYRKAIELNPNYSTAHQWLAELYMAEGRFQEAHEEIDKGIELDPKAPIMKVIKAQIYVGERRFDDAISLLGGILEEIPGMDIARIFLAHAYLGKKDYERARKTAEGLVSPGWKEIFVARVSASQGDRKNARLILENYLKANPDVYLDPGQMMLVYGDFGDADKAYELYEKALRDKSTWPVVFLRVCLPSEFILKDLRFQEILSKK